MWGFIGVEALALAAFNWVDGVSLIMLNRGEGALALVAYNRVNGAPTLASPLAAFIRG